MRDMVEINREFKITFCLLSLILSFFLVSCSFLFSDRDSDKTSSIKICFDSVSQGRGVKYTENDLSYFAVSIDPKVQDDIRVDVANGEMKAVFTGLESGTYKIAVSGFAAGDAKIAHGESERVEVRAGESTSVIIEVRFMGQDDNIPVPEGFVRVDGITLTGTETWVPTSKVFIGGRQLTIPTLIACDHEVTRGEFKAIMENDPSQATAYDKDGNELTGEAVLNNPVNYTNWYAAITYCNKLSLAEGLTPCYSVEDITDWESLEFSAVPTNANDAKWNSATCNFNANGYRLPTEAEWEWLARGGQNYTYAGSNTVDDVAWYQSNSNITGGVKGTREVKTKNANGYGLYDMSGNVWELCWDWYETPLKSAYGKTGPASGSDRVTRGGSWGRGDSYCAIAQRANLSPYTCNTYYGFRVVRTVVVAQ